MCDLSPLDGSTFVFIYKYIITRYWELVSDAAYWSVT